MPVNLNPYLNFRGTAREAMTFYREVFGGEVVISTFAEFGQGDDPARADLVMHGQLETEAGFLLMGSDVPEGMPWTRGENDFSVSVSGDDETRMRAYWDRLAEGADVSQPLEQAPWGDSFGMLRDRFGVSWLFNISPAKATA